MTLERAATGASAIDVLDRVLDKGIIIDTWMDVSIAGISLFTVEGRMVVASIETYLKHAPVIGEAVSLMPRLLARHSY